MIRLRTACFGATSLLLLALAADAQTIQPTGGSGGASLASCSTANGIMFLQSSVIKCDTGLTYAGAAGALVLGAAPINIGNAAGTGNICLGATACSSSSLFVNNRTTAWNGGVVGWASGSDPSAAADTGLSRVGAGIVAIGNGTALSTAGIIQTGTASLVSLTTGTNADFLCLGSTGTVFLQTTACTISSLRFKPDWAPYKDNALKKVVNMEVGTFHIDIPNRDPNSESLQAGLNAENIAKIAPECAVYEDDMKTPKSYRQECVIGLLVKAIQQLKASR